MVTGLGPEAPDAAILLEEVRSASDRLVATIEQLAATGMAEASLLPGWNRAHLLTHIARNADGARNLLLAVRSGRAVRMYASPELREADIATGAGRPADVVLADAIESSRRFVLDAESMPVHLWSGELPSGSAATAPVGATMPLRMRLREVELHHVDLATGYGFRDTPERLLRQLLEDVIRTVAEKGVAVRSPVTREGQEWTVETGGATHAVSGPPDEMLGWLSGRSSGKALASPGALPVIPSLG